MSEAPDHAITRQARAILRRRWIDIDHVDFGSVNGVIYLRGGVKRNPPPAASASAADPNLTLIRALERELHAIDGVKDLVLEIEGYEQRGDRWQRQAEAVAGDGE
jgi:hypothetical protein